MFELASSIQRHRSELGAAFQPTKYPWIDALRGIAILLVIAVHVFSTVPSPSAITAVMRCGQFGVQLFFVLSAITLCMSQQLREKEAAALQKFYVRRCFRIAPAYWIGIAIYFLWSIAQNYVRFHQFIPAPQYDVLNMAVNMLLIHGLIPSANDNIVPGGWSIGAEVLFYIAFPFIWKLQKNMSIKYLFFGLLASVGAALIFLYVGGMFSYSVKNNEFLYFNIINQLPVFLLGIILYRCFSIDSVIRYRFLCFLIFSGAAAFMVAQDNWMVTATMPFVSACAFSMLILMVRSASQAHIPVWLIAVGKVSFSIYIFHFLVWYVSEYALKTIAPSVVESNAAGFILFVMVASITFAIAQLSYRYVEKYFIGLGERWARSW